MQKLVGRWAPLLLVATLAVLAISSVSAMLGDITAHQAVRQERRWFQGAPVTDLQWRAAESNLKKALGYSPSHPDYLRGLGRLSSWFFSVSDGVGAETSASTGQQGLDYLRQLTGQRPYWPDGWSDLALLKSQLGEFDDEFDQAFANAFALGPNEPQVLLTLSNTALSRWSSLGMASRQQALQVFARGLQSRGAEMRLLSVAEKYGMQKAVCLMAAPEKVSGRVRKTCAL
ncbi:hypothetical protein [Pseudomaricurvus sp. HS19]|uniref:hypothetical protein n=1 Tax=Pseudomaricurvus sp. HS19 TaxID=2692626 RepID=UPI001370F87E|nr:hypothetical protein [Pseudomaricurvus sp. HS19]MYM65121.1 hypothetical protein [Pseudomaricurvus sp. HS19]